MNKEISVGIVTYNSEEEIPKLMDSLKESGCFEKIAVYVADNASHDATLQVLKKDYPWVKLLTSSRNLGFGAGHNRIIKHVKSKYHIIVNPDIRVEHDTIEKCAAYMDQNEDITILTPKILNTDGTQQFLPKRNPSIQYLIGGLFERYSKKCERLREEYTMKNAKVDTPVDIEFCTGCFMFTRTSVLKRAGGFDERYFLHFEDADLTRELRKYGRAVYHPDITVTHKWKRENKKLSKGFFIALRSMRIYLKKWK